MQKNTLLLLVLVGVVVIAGGYMFFAKDAMTERGATAPLNEASQPVTAVAGEGVATEPTIPAAPIKVQEFVMNAYYDEKGKWYSLKEMSVKKGDSVRVLVTNTKGMHDFNIDELGIARALPLNEQVTIEFTADKAGDFVYYCSLPGHRAGGQWGTLHVTE